MADSRTFWLTVMNIALGVAVLLFLLIILSESVRELLSKPLKRRSYRSELNHDMREMFGPPHQDRPRHRR